MLFLVFLFFVIISLPAKASANGEVVISDDSESIQLNHYIHILEDQDNMWTIEQVSSDSFRQKFTRNDGRLPNYGYTDSSYWVRFDVTNLSNKNLWLLELDNTTMDYVTFYVPSESGRNEYETHMTGDLFPFKQRELKHRNFVLELDLPLQETSSIYIHFKTEGAMNFPLTIWSEDRFIEKTQREYIIIGLLFGIVSVMALYNLFLYFVLRNKSYLFYVVFIIASSLTQIAFLGLGYQYLWPEAIWWNNRSIVFFMCLSNIAGLLFAKVFLDMKRYTPMLNKLIKPIIIFNLFLIVLLYFSYPIALVVVMVSLMFFIIFIVVSAYLSYRRGYHAARFFLLAWCILLLGVIITGLVDSGFLPLMPYTKYAWQITSVIEVVLFSFALADKINMMRIEKDEAKKDAIESKEMALESLKRTNKLKDEFLAVTSHEIRTPLNGIIGIAETMKDGAAGEITDSMNKNLGMIITSGRRLSHLIDDILDFSSLKNDVLELNFKRVYLHELTEVVLTMCKTLVKHKNLKLVNKIPKTIPPVLADENRLQQILYNLIGNGIKYTEEGSITVLATYDEHAVVLTVQDTGIGIPEDQLESIFLPFQQGDHTSAGGYGGTGIGLNITKRLIELHQGYITVDSNKGEGSTFTFTLPKYENESEREVASSVSSLPSIKGTETITLQESILNRQSGKTGKRIMVADDELVNLQVLINHLTLGGYEVDIAKNGLDTLNRIDQKEYDLLILDIMMPKMSGYEVCRQIRVKYSLTELPVLMLTAKNQLDDRITAFELGANDYLTKPFEREELLARVKTLVDLKQATKKLNDHANKLDKMNNQLKHMNDELEDKVRERTKELRNINSRLEELNANLRKTEKSRRQLLSNISHDLGTPITFLHSYVQSVREGLIDYDDTRYLQLVENKIQMLDRLTEDLFDLAKFESGQMTLNIKQHYLDDWLDAIYSKFDVDVSERNIAFTYPDIIGIENGLEVSILIDCERMDQVFSNLIYNAMKYTPKGGLISITANVKRWEVRKDKDFDGEAIISVSDTGQGIDPESLPHIFDRFYQGTPSNKQDAGGTGLGLAITKEIIQYHKGEIWVESKVNGGSTFYFTLPIVFKGRKGKK